MDYIKPIKLLCLILGYSGAQNPAKLAEQAKIICVKFGLCKKSAALEEQGIGSGRKTQPMEYHPMQVVQQW